MRILITGAYGFLGSHIAAHLSAQGHHIIAAGRDKDLGQRRFPFYDWISCDFNSDTTVISWLPRLINVDAVINCVGILQGSARDKSDAIHRDAPAALFQACEKVGIRRVIQISALGIGADGNSDYATSKAAGEAALAELDLDWVILRPSLVYGRGTYGGTTLLRGLAGIPLITPVPDSVSLIQPVCIEDLARTVAQMTDPNAPSKLTLDVVGPETMSAAEFISAQRRWLGFRPQPRLRIPKFLSAMVFKLGDIAGWFGSRTAMRSTFLAMMDTPNIAPVEPLIKATGTLPQSVAEAFAATPAQSQDRWHARLIFLRPLLRITLGVFWLVSGLVLLHPHAFASAITYVEAAGFPPSIAPAFVAIGGSMLDIILGLLLLIGWRTKAILLLQFFGTLGYIGALTFSLPELWLDALGPLTKTVPLLVFTLALLAMEEER